MLLAGNCFVLAIFVVFISKFGIKKGPPVAVMPTALLTETWQMPDVNLDGLPFDELDGLFIL